MKNFILGSIVLLIGIAIGGKVINLAYKPILVAQAIEIAQKEEDNRQIQARFKLIKVELEAHRQDMELFKSESALIEVLRQLGIVVK